MMRSAACFRGSFSEQSPFLNHLSTKPFIRRPILKVYCSRLRPILLCLTTYIALLGEQYRSVR